MSACASCKCQGLTRSELEGESTPDGKPRCWACWGDWKADHWSKRFDSTVEAMYAYELAGSEEGARELLRKASGCSTACMTCGADVPDLGPLKTPFFCKACTEAKRSTPQAARLLLTGNWEDSASLACGCSGTCTKNHAEFM